MPLKHGLAHSICAAAVAASLTWANLPAGDAIHAWDFMADEARFNYAPIGSVTNTPNLSFARASASYAPNAAGLLVPFASGVLRRTDKGALIEAARTNLALWSNDWTNAAWVKVNVTATQDQAGPDGVAASATRLTATGANGTALQAIVSASANRYGSVWVRRITGAGDIDITLDAGVAWTTIAVTGAWTRLGKAQTGVTNPTVGLRIVTSGDEIAVWCGQVESADGPSSPIPTTTGSVTRASDVGALTSPGVDYPLTLYAEFERTTDVGGNAFMFHIDAGGNNDRAFIANTTANADLTQMVRGGVLQATLSVAGALSLNTVYKEAARFSTNSVHLARNATLAVEDTGATVPATPTTIRFGSSGTSTGQAYAFLRRLAIFPRALSNAELQTITT